MKAAEAVEVRTDSILKTLLLKSDEKLIAALICGLRKLDYKKVKRLLGVKKIRLLHPDEIREYTPFEVGGISPFFSGIYRFVRIMDKSCLDNDEVLLGGGDAFHLVKIDINELIDILQPKIADISK